MKTADKNHLAAREKHGINYTNTEEELEDHAIAVNRDKFNWIDIPETDNSDYYKIKLMRITSGVNTLSKIFLTITNYSTTSGTEGTNFHTRK